MVVSGVASAISAPSIGLVAKSMAGSMITNLYKCGVQEFDLDITSHPTQSSIGDSEMALYMGAIVYNTLIQAGGLALFWLANRLCQNQFLTNDHFPGPSMFLCIFLFQPMCFACLRLLSNGSDDQIGYTIGALGLMLHLSFVVFVWWYSFKLGIDTRYRMLYEHLICLFRKIKNRTSIVNYPTRLFV